MPLLFRAARVDEIPPGTCRAAKVGQGRGTLLVCNVDGTFHTIGAKCPHMGLPLRKGDFRGTTVTCRYHGAEIDVRTGTMVKPPNRDEWAKGSLVRRVAALLGRLKKPKRDGCGSYRTLVRGGQVFVALDRDREDAPAEVQRNAGKPEPVTP